MDNEAALRHFFEEINAGDVNAAAELLADGFVEHEVCLASSRTKKAPGNFFR